MNPLELDLAQFYDQDAHNRVIRDADPLRVDPFRLQHRARFLDLLAQEGRGRILDVGIGTGVDAIPMVDSGFTVAGVDLSREHVARCQDLGIDARVASVLDLPFASGEFDAAWSMSTFMHLPDRDFGDALCQVRQVCGPGAPMALGCWGGDDTEGEYDRDTFEPRRYFRWRSSSSLREMLAEYATIEAFETWAAGSDSHHEYQWALLRFT